MADHQFVELVIDWLEAEWNSSNYPGSFDGSTPAIVDGDDGESTSFSGREVAYDLTDNNAVIVKSTPDRTQEAIGTEFDYRFEDAVAIEVAAAHEDLVNYPNESGAPGVTGSDEFRALYQEVRRILHGHRTYPDPDGPGGQSTHTLGIFDESNLSGQYGDLYVYEITATVRGYEGLP